MLDMGFIKRLDLRALKEMHGSLLNDIRILAIEIDLRERLAADRAAKPSRADFKIAETIERARDGDGATSAYVKAFAAMRERAEARHSAKRKRDLQIIQLAADNHTGRDIAAKLKISAATVSRVLNACQ